MQTANDKNAARLDWGNGKALKLVNKGDGFDMTFDGVVPPTKTIKVDAIDILGKCRPLIVSPANGSTVSASGLTETAYRARVYLIEDGVPQIREAAIPGTEQMKYVKGPNGGSLIFIGHDGETATAEVIESGKDWKIVFADDGKELKAPAAHDVEIEAIGPTNAKDQVRRLSVSSTPDGASLRISGETANATYVRLAIKDGNHWHTRCAPLV